MSQITTHILDTSIGKPAEGVKIELHQSNSENWTIIGSGITNNDGRVSDLLDKDSLLEPGIYKMVFMTEDYFKSLKTQTFYPKVEIIFETFDKEHYHVPLLLNPFGYSTYRGS